MPHFTIKIVKLPYKMSYCFSIKTGKLIRIPVDVFVLRLLALGALSGM